MEIERAEKLATIAKLYYEDELKQAQVSSRMGYSRSMISRMLTEARQNKIIEIKINFPLQRAQNLETCLRERFNLKDIRVLGNQFMDYGEMLNRLGIFGAKILFEYLKPGMTIGVAWGSALKETIHAVNSTVYMNVNVIQLMGAVGTPQPEFDGPALTEHLAKALGGGYSILSAPFIVDSSLTRDALAKEKRIQALMKQAEKLDIALVGIGAADIKHSALVRAGYLSLKDAQDLVDQGAVGDVCGRFYDIHGRILENQISTRIMSIQAESLKNASVRIGVAGGESKVQAVLGALNGGLVNALVTDNIVASALCRSEENELVL